MVICYIGYIADGQNEIPCEASVKTSSVFKLLQMVCDAHPSQCQSDALSVPAVIADAGLSVWCDSRDLHPSQTAVQLHFLLTDSSWINTLNVSCRCGQGQAVKGPSPNPDKTPGHSMCISSHDVHLSNQLKDEIEQFSHCFALLFCMQVQFLVLLFPPFKLKQRLWNFSCAKDETGTNHTTDLLLQNILLLTSTKELKLWLITQKLLQGCLWNLVGLRLWWEEIIEWFQRCLILHFDGCSYCFAQWSYECVTGWAIFNI